MKFLEISKLEELITDDKERVVALGFFDGLHIAHQKIIKETVQKAKNTGRVATLITFDKSPREYFLKKSVKLVTQKDEKLKILKSLELEEVYIIEFNEELRNLPRENFISDILLKINTREIFCGYDYKFGFNGLGYPEFINEYTSGKILVNKLDKLLLDKEKISTTKLNDLIKEGKLKEYIEYTGRAYSIKGTVVKGKQLGRTIGFPTANMELEYNYILPKKLGVYFTKIKIDNAEYFGITNIGNNPTVNNDNTIFVETHILNFDEFIYGEKVSLFFYDFIRSEKKFSGINELKEQLTKDKKLAFELQKKFKNC